MKNNNTAKPQANKTLPLKKEIFDTFLKKVIESPKVKQGKKLKRKLSLLVGIKKRIITPKI